MIMTKPNAGAASIGLIEAANASNRCEPACGDDPRPMLFAKW